MGLHRRPRRPRDTSSTTTDPPTRDGGPPGVSLAATLEMFPGLPDAVRLVSPDGTSHPIGIRYQGSDLPDHHLYQARVPASARLVNGMVALFARDVVVGVVVRDEVQYRNIGRLR